MKKYNKDATCVKCGGSTVSTKFVPSRKIYNSYSSETGEWMERECKTCGYVWKEESLDTKEASR